VWEVACLGELVIDLAPHGEHGATSLYAASPGGAPGSVATGLARLGRSVVMLAKVGDDAFGRLIVRSLMSSGVDTAGVSAAPRARTGLSVVSLAPDGDRDFMFYRDDPADLCFSVDDVTADLVEGTSLLHVGGLLMSDPRSAAAQEKAIRLAQAAGRPVSVDPNFRPALWADRQDMLRSSLALIVEAAIVKLTVEELRALTGKGPVEDAARSLWHQGLKVLAVTDGARGAELFTPGRRLSCEGFAVAAVDTTAAGDAFMAALLSGLLEIDLEDASGPQLALVLRQACAAGALAATRKGAMESLPSREEIMRLASGSPG
jgi:fructokinase